MENVTVNILGSTYSIRYVDYNQDAYLKKEDLSGYCSFAVREIVIAIGSSIPEHSSDTEKENLVAEKQTLRHEIVHAFLYESGLHAGVSQSSGPWSQNEEMVDWIALQGPKIFKAWQEVDAL